MKTWVSKALNLLTASLEPPKHKLNELDWKAALSPDKKRLTEYLSAFFVDIIAQQQGLNFQIKKLRRTRDLLLPRLLSGQINLS